MNPLKIILLAVLIFSFIVLTPLQVTQASTYYDHQTIIAMFKDLADKHPRQASYIAIGKSVESRSIWMFTIGNPNGGRVVWDASIHGSEDIGAIVAYYFAEWLLTSDSPVAKTILQKNSLYIIPVANPDSNARENDHGVNLNHNFAFRWYNSPFAYASDAYDYKGSSPASEPETKAMRYVFATYRPRYYVNSHMWGGPWIGYVNAMPYSMYNPVIERMKYYAGNMNVSTFPVTSLSARGFAAGDAFFYGANAWLLEIIGQIGRPSLSQVKSVYLPKCESVLFAMLSLAGGWT